MYTIVVRKKDGTLVEFTHEKKLSFLISRRDADTVSVWIQGEPGGNIAEVEGVEAWRKEALVLPSTDYTGYYSFTGEGNKSEVCGIVNSFLYPDGETRFSLYVLGDDKPGNVHRSHKEWLALGFVPVKKVD